MEKKRRSLSRIKNMLDRLNNGLGPRLSGSCGFRHRSSHFYVAMVIIPTVSSVCNVLEIPYVPLGQHCLFSFFLTLSH